MAGSSRPRASEISVSQEKFGKWWHRYDYKKLTEALGIKGRQAGLQLYSKCPVHDDRTPSFDVNLSTGAWTCHAPHCISNDPEMMQKQLGETREVHRNFATLVALTLSVSLAEAQQWLENGTFAPSIESLQDDLEQSLRAIEDVPVGEFAQQVAREAWANLPVEGPMPMALFRRGITWETARRFELRYDPIRLAVVIPVRDEGGEVTGTIHWFPPEQKPPLKYVNSAGLPRERVLFGLCYLPQDDRRAIFLAEGPFDVMWLQQNGYPAVGLMGSYLGPDQIRLLEAYPQIVIVTDNDAPGVKARSTIAKRLLVAGRGPTEIYVATCPPGKDPNDCSAEELQQVFAAAQTLLEWELTNGRIE